MTEPTKGRGGPPGDGLPRSSPGTATREYHGAELLLARSG